MMKAGLYIVIGAILFALSACSPLYRNHGYIPPQEDLDQLAIGIDTRGTVEDLVGPPSSMGMLEGGNLFYVRSRMRTLGPFEPREIERQVLAISFDEDGVLKNIERFGLEDGRIVALDRRSTTSSVSEVGFLRQLFGNIGGVAL